MKNFRNIFLVLFALLFSMPKTFSASVWINDLRTIFSSNNAIIYAINIRTFNAKDTNKDGIIDESIGEERGNFSNAVDRLDELVSYGINTVNLLPVTSTGKIKALGTAGSLYAPLSFNEINSQLKSKNNNSTAYDEMKKFVNECHRRNIRVIVDLPCCASYDLYLNNPELFKTDKNKAPIVPADWTDVRLLDSGSESQINSDVYSLYSEFIDLMLSLDVDGIRANVPTIKPYTFWRKLIDETRGRSPEFLFLAEASPLWNKPISEHAVFTPYNKLLDAGFDGYYGDYFDLKNWKTSKDLISHVKFNLDIAKKYLGHKSTIGSFATHDQISPILINGIQYSKMIIWLNATLPLNSYFVDGFPTGDDYIYFWGNKKAQKSFTDDDYYFVHRGQLDIFNFSRKPAGNHYDVYQDFIIANKFKLMAGNLLGKGKFTPLRTSSPSVFAYERSYDKESVVVIGNLDFKRTQKIVVNVPNLTKNTPSIPIKISSIPITNKGKIKTDLTPGEVQVIYFNSPEPK